MGLLDEVRAHCARVAAAARSVRIEHDALAAFDGAPEARLDPELHLIDGSPEEVARHMLTLDAINFGSGWFPTLRKRPGRSGYATIAAALAERARAEGPWSNAALRALDAAAVADVLGQARDHELMSLYAQALRELGAWLGERDVLAAVAAADGSAEAFASSLARGMAMFRDHGFYKRAQIAPADLALAGVARFDDLDRLTIFADNFVPHVLRCDGVLVYDPRLAAHIDAGRNLRPGPQEREIRACAVHACELLSAQLGVPPRVLDNWLWTRGQGASYTRHAPGTAAAACTTEEDVVRAILAGAMWTVPFVPRMRGTATGTCAGRGNGAPAVPPQPPSAACGGSSGRHMCRSQILIKRQPPAGLRPLTGRSW